MLGIEKPWALIGPIVISLIVPVNFDELTPRPELATATPAVTAAINGTATRAARRMFKIPTSS